MITLEQVLQQRHKAAGPVVDVDEPQVKLVMITLGNDWFAFHGERIREVLADLPVYFLPGCPSSLEGVINVRGDIESVIQLQSLLGLPAPLASDASRILLAHTASMRSGIRVDQVEDVLDLPQSAIQPPPHTIAEHLRPFTLGILTFRSHLVHLLDLDQLFAVYRAGLK
jgi:purine-binding chemotaxis protein CheW